MIVARLIALLLFASGLAAAQGNFSQDSSYAFLRHIAVDIGPRPMGSPAEQQGLRYAAEQFRRFGCDTSYVMPMDFSSRVNTTSGIAVGIKYGSTERSIVIGGHMDSKGAEIQGADDDGSGSAVVLECARILCSSRHASTIVFCAFGGEEQGLEGSQYFVSRYPDLDSVRLMLQVDMANGLGTLNLDPEMGGGMSAPRWLVRAAIEECSALGYPGLVYPTHFFSYNYAHSASAGSDHESFLEHDIPSIDFTTDVDRPIHTPQDNIDNFDPRGLKRSGDIVLRLVQRFDAGTPSRSLERYWLILLGETPLFLSIPAVETFALLSIALAVITFIRLRREQRPAPTAPPAGWSGLKIFLAALVIGIFFWMPPLLVGWMKGLRFPWFALPGDYFALMLCAALAGVVVALRILRRLRLGTDPAGLFLRGTLVTIIMMLIFFLYTPKLLMEPAMALVLTSLALLVPSRLVGLVALAPSPIWLFRLIFSEWMLLLLRSVALQGGGDHSPVPLILCVLILFTATLLFSFLSAAAALVRRHEKLTPLPGLLSGKHLLYASLVASAGALIFLLLRPSYDPLWPQPVTAVATYDISDHHASASVQSIDNLRGKRIQWGNCDSVISGNARRVEFDGNVRIDTTWVTVERADSITLRGDSTLHDITLRIRSLFRPYVVTARYSSSHPLGPSFRTPWKVRSDGSGGMIIDWFAFPETSLVVPVHFALAKGDTAGELISVQFARIDQPVEVTGGPVSLIGRTTYTFSKTYR